ncbi:hypothetical protein D3C85_1826190 [compost metagenome]
MARSSIVMSCFFTSQTSRSARFREAVWKSVSGVVGAAMALSRPTIMSSSSAKSWISGKGLRQMLDSLLNSMKSPP